MYYTQSKTEWKEDRWLVPLIPFRQTLTESTNRKRLYKLTETERVLGFIPDKWDEQYKLSLHTFLSTITKKKNEIEKKFGSYNSSLCDRRKCNCLDFCFSFLMILVTFFIIGLTCTFKSSQVAVECAIMLRLLVNHPFTSQNLAIRRPDLKQLPFHDTLLGFVSTWWTRIDLKTVPFLDQ